MNNMPILQPVPIPTKGKSFFRRIGSWLFSARKWKVAEEWKCYTSINGVRQVITIPKGFIFDGASVPKFLWPLLSPTGILLKAGLVHDYAYRYQELCFDTLDPDIGCTHFCDDHKFWDKVFRDISVEDNGCKFISYSAYYALILFGGFAWRSNRKLEKARDQIRKEENKKELNSLSVFCCKNNIP